MPARSATAFDEAATLLIGLVGNLDHVRAVSDGKAYALTAAEASEALGHDVKDLGRDRGRLSAYATARSTAAPASS